MRMKVMRIIRASGRSVERIVGVRLRMDLVAGLGAR
jgi:hypothetical protein